MCACIDHVLFCPDRYSQAQLLGLAEEAEETQVVPEEAELQDTEPDEEEGGKVEDPVEVAGDGKIYEVELEDGYQYNEAVQLTKI